MDSLQSWLMAAPLAESAAWGWPVWVGLFLKLTFALSVAWLLHACLWRANPRWRRLLWRTAAVGCAVIALSLAFPPLVSWNILPGTQAEVAHVDITTTPTFADAALPTTDVGPPRQHRGFNSSPQSAFARGSRDSAHRRTELRDGNEPKSGVAASPMATSKKGIPPVSPSIDSSSANAPTIRLSTLLTGVWLSGVLLFALHTLLGIYRLARIRRRAALAPVAILERAQEICDRLGCRRIPQILVTEELASPCILGVFSPVILLPTAQTAPALAQELPAILAHELAHLRGYDVAWQLVIHAVATLGWFHPLLWRTRAAHALACDAVSDCVAADYVGDAASYGRTLARLALRMVPTAATGMAMAQRSTVRLRIEMLRRRLFPASLRRGPALCAIAVSLMMFLLIGGFAFAQAGPESKTAPTATQSKPVADSAKAPAPSPQPGPEPTVVPAATQPKSIAIHVVDSSGQPVAKARIRFVGRVNGKRFDRYVRSDAEGHAIFDVPMAGKFTSFSMHCEKPGLVAIHYSWSADNQEIRLPAELNLRMEQGMPGGGVVNDEAGRPIKNAKIDVSMPITWPRRANYVYTVVDAKTDEQGRWKSAEMPANLTDVSVRVSHPDYIQGHGKFSGRENVAVLTQGLTVAGRVTDADGKPIAKAKARAGFSRFGTNEPETTTDADGRFVLKNCKEGKSIVTVQADGFAPQFKDALIGPKNEDINFQLGSGNTARVRLVDPRGNPVQGVYFCTDTWRGYRTLDLRIQTDAEGRAQWPSAPDDTVLCDFFKTGHMSARRVPIKAGADEIVVKIPDELVISGTVTDAETGKPIPEFGVRSGLVFENSDRVYLSQDEPTKFQDGAYTFKFTEPQRALLLEFSAKGYKPLESKHFLPTDGQQTFDAKLTPTQGTGGVVLLPNGQPAVGAEIALTTADNNGYLSSGYFRRGLNNSPVVKSDASGAFMLAPRDEKTYKLYVVHDAGYAEILKSDFLASKQIRLQPWGRIEGRVMLGDKPDPNREVKFWPMLGREQSQFGWIYFDFTTQTDQDGRFTFDRIIPGKGSVARVVVTKFIDSTSHAPCWQVPVDVPPAGTVTATIGGVGRPVVGQVKLDRQPDVVIDWTTNEPATINLQETDKKERTHFRCGANIDRDGKFTIPDVPAGKYKLSFSINNPPTPNACGAGEAIGRAMFDFEVPPMTDGRSDEPLDLGTITATLFDTLEPGEVAPGFVLAGLNGDSVRLSDFHGKLVLLDFWATWCQPCLAEMPALAEIQREFGDNSRFAMVGLSCDQQIEPPREYVQKKGFDWVQAHAGAVGAGTGSTAGKYAVRALPATYLIGPDGRVLAKNLRGKELKQAIAAALADEALFKAAAATAPPARFPIVRFKDTWNPADAPPDISVVVLDDSDPDWDQKAAHHDRLTAYASDDTQLWTIGDLNTCQQVGYSGALAIDRTRQRIYSVEQVSKRMLAIDFSGRKQWQAEQIDASALAIDGTTGNIWITGGPNLNQGETIVLDPAGNELAAYPFVGIDIAADEQRGVFWLAGYEILQCDRGGQIRVRVPVSKSGGWCCATVAVDPTDGSAWFGEREHPDIPDSRNRLWHVDSSGQVRQKLELEKSYPLRVIREPASGDLWIVSYPRELRRLGADGQFKTPLAIEANNVAFGRTSGIAWVATEKELLKMDTSGNVLLRKAFEKPSQQAWLVTD